MKNRKGFTLLELIGVIVILSLLVLIITPIVNNVMKESKEKLYQRTLDNIELSARDWTTDEVNKELLPKTDGNCIILKLSDLKASGHIDLNVKDPRNNTLLSDNDTLVLVTKKNANYEYKVITDGDISSTNCQVELPDPTAPVIQANVPKEIVKNVNLTISYTTDYGLLSSNSYQYYLSNSMNALSGGSWITYQNNISQNIGSNLNGTYYLFVKRISNLENIKSLVGGVLVDIGSETYQRFGPYKFDNTKPIWTFYSKTNTNSTSPTPYQNLIYTYDNDTITITFRGNDINYKSSSLNINNIGILFNSVDYTNSVSKSLSSAKKISNGVEYTLTISGITAKGKLSLRIASNTLLDKASNTNDDTIIDTGIIANTCIYGNGQSWEFAYTGKNVQFVAPCRGEYTIELYGAQGGNTSGGKGAYTKGDIRFNRNFATTVIVGGQNGYNGGGKGSGANGGGATDVRMGGTSINNRVMVAAGGGAGGTQTGTAGGVGGTTQGGSGSIASVGATICSSCTNAEPGQREHKSSSCSGYDATFGCVARAPSGGTQSSGGTYGITWHVNPELAYWSGTAGQLYQGGNATAASSSGGGGGYYGGGGSAISPIAQVSGAGGSSCISGYSGCSNATYQFSNVAWTAGTRTGNGYAKITLKAAD